VTRLRTLAALAVVALVGAGCSGNGGSGEETASNWAKGMRFAECMRENGVRAFPDPNASGELTIDGVANGSSLDTSSAAFTEAIGACRDLEPSGFTGHKRSAQQQENGLEFAHCMRDNGVKDFPDPAEDGPLIDTTRIPSAAGRGARSIPGFQAAVERCRAALAGALKDKEQR
jgi:hypothetical protein